MFASERDEYPFQLTWPRRAKRAYFIHVSLTFFTLKEILPKKSAKTPPRKMVLRRWSWDANYRRPVRPTTPPQHDFSQVISLYGGAWTLNTVVFQISVWSLHSFTTKAPWRKVEKKIWLLASFQRALACFVWFKRSFSRHLRLLWNSIWNSSPHAFFPTFDSTNVPLTNRNEGERGVPCGVSSLPFQVISKDLSTDERQSTSFFPLSTHRYCGNLLPMPMTRYYIHSSSSTRNLCTRSPLLWFG